MTLPPVLQCRRRRPALAFLAVLLTVGCAGPYFRHAGPPPPPTSVRSLSEWPFDTYWTGIVFNGAKIGFSHLTLSRTPDSANTHTLNSEAAFRIRFLAFDKRINLTAADRVNPDLSMVDFVYEYDFDGNRMKLTGRCVGGRLTVEIETRGQTERETLAVEGPLYPTSVINLYPVMHGLAPGRRYRYAVYDGETRRISRVEQEVLAYEESLLFRGAAFKIRTRLHGQEVTTWIDGKGRPVLEMSMGGVLISELESPILAKQYLAQAAVNKAETFLDFSRIPVDRPISDPRKVRTLEIRLLSTGREPVIPDDELQQCHRESDHTLCRIVRRELPEKGESPDLESSPPGEKDRFLKSSLTVPAFHPRIREKAFEIVQGEKGDRERIDRLLGWIESHVRPEPVDVFTALDVLDEGRGECQAHAILYAAFARALGIPTRVVNGIVYSKAVEGFLYHTWAESRIDGFWIAVDPTFGQLPADATHVKLIEGEAPGDLLPLVEVIGRLKVEILSVSR